ncbi:MAG: YfiR family protein [bacterium]|nr:YfiR family protein [bacterium]
MIWSLIHCLPDTALASPSKALPEYEVKAGYIYRFLHFIDWPDDAFASSTDSLVIGIIGRNPFDEAFNPIEGKVLNGRRLVVITLPSSAPSEAILHCHVLFFSASLDDILEELLTTVNGHPVLTVSDVPNFTQKGGMINFIFQGDRLGFEVNKAATNRSGLHLRSKMLRLASNVVTGG